MMKKESCQKPRKVVTARILLSKKNVALRKQAINAHP